MDEFHEIADGRRVRAGTKVEFREDGVAVGWGAVRTLLPDRQVLIDRLDTEDSYPCDAELGEGAIYVDDWSPRIGELQAERWRQAWRPADVDAWPIGEGGEVRVGTKVEVWDGGTAHGEDLDWGEVTQVLTNRTVAVHWYADGETAICDVDEISDLIVDDWGPEIVTMMLRKRAQDGR